jgi:hypothetical protein
MAISGIGSWLPTIDEFIAHWISVNTVVGLPGFTLPGGYSEANFAADRGTLNGMINAVEAALNLRTTAAGDRDVKRAGIRPRMLQFGPTVRGALAGSRHIPSLRDTPRFTSSPGVWRQGMADMLDLWTAINTNSPAVPGFTPPLLLSGAYAVAGFNTEKNALDAAFTAIGTTQIGLEAARETRDLFFHTLYLKMKAYRLTVAAALPVGSPLAGTIPALTPPPGATPEPVNLSGSWSAPDVKAALVWSASTRPDLDHYSVRYHPGPRYKADEEQTVSLVLPGTTDFLTDFGLAASGSVAWYKVYVVTTTGNEKGSNAVKVIRP